MAARYFIGIDLGTSNCSLSYVDRKEDTPRSRVFKIPQYEKLDTLVEQNTLPSFCYYLSDVESAELDKSKDHIWSQNVVVGSYAKNAFSQHPDRAIASAKSWLCHDGVDRESKILPWQSAAIAHDQQRSPVEASASYLEYLRFAWDESIGMQSKESAFDRQEIVITVPASFDTIAQRLTLEAAQLAAYPDSIRLIEEPQAAFYSWLERHQNSNRWSELLPELDSGAQTVLVCDIGGGTSDFSLFEISTTPDSQFPGIRRIAVSDHILLGGDNIDLALAHLAETRLPTSETKSSSRWAQIVAQCRALKERALSSEGDSDESFTIALASSGSSLFGGAQSASLTRKEIYNTVLDGFFGICDADAKTQRRQSGLRELGLPYAIDSSVTRHLAEFLRQRPVNAVLFNGGSLNGAVIQERLRQAIVSWQPETELRVLSNNELDLAVARGAAFCRWSQHASSELTIESGSGHSFYLEVAYAPKKKRRKRARSEKRLICVLPHASEAEQRLRLSQLDLALHVNQPVNFQAYASSRRESDQLGDLIQLNEVDFHRLPSLHTMAQLPPTIETPETGTIPVQIESRINDLGILQLSCQSVKRIGNRHRKWALEFNMREAISQANENDASQAETDSQASGASSVAIEAAVALIEETFSLEGESPLKLVKTLETTLKEVRQNWQTGLIRQLWQALYGRITSRSLSQDHEQTWLNLAGFALRPGYGSSLDEYRIKNLWFIVELGLDFPKSKAIREQYCLLWRRTSGGLDARQQESLYSEWIDRVLADTKQSYEPARMMGSFERLSKDKRVQLAAHFISSIKKRSESYCDHSIWALGRLLSRVPLYGGENAILPQEIVGDAFSGLKDLDWTANNLKNLPELFIQASRIVQNRDHDLETDLRTAIVEKLRASSVPEDRIQTLEKFVPIASKDLQLLFGESLPLGLSLNS